MKNFSKFALFALVLMAVPLSAQLSTTNTTLTSPIAANTTAQVCVASATGIVVPSVAVAGSLVSFDKEIDQVLSAGASANCFKVRRGVLGTSAAYSHATGAKVWVGQPATGTGDSSRPFSGGAFAPNIPSGICTASAQYTLPIIVYGTLGGGTAVVPYNCIGGYWVVGEGQNPSAVPYTSFATFPAPPATTATSVTDVAGTIWTSQLAVPFNGTLTGACVLNGATVGTDKWIVALYDSTGALVANSALAGTTTAGVSIMQCLPFVSTLAVYGPGTYYLALQGNGTTDNFKAYAAGMAPTNYGTNSQTGVFGTLAAVTPSITFTAGKGPIGSVY